MNSKRQSKTLSITARHRSGKAELNSCRDEKGLVLIAAIGLIAILALLGTVSAITTVTEIKISGNYKTNTKALYAAQAGIEEARARLRGSSGSNYAGDTIIDDPLWAAYILTSSASWESTSDDPDYDAAYTSLRYPALDNPDNTTKTDNSLQSDISYWVKIRHKREADLFSDEQCNTENGSGPNDIIYYGYATSTSTTAEQFTSDDDPANASPVEIITSYGSSNNSSGIIEIQARRLPGPPIVAAIYGKSVDIDGHVDITGNDDTNCSLGSDPVPCVGYSDDFPDPPPGQSSSLTSYAGESTLINPTLVMGAYVDQLESTATIFLYDEDDPLQNYSVGSDSNYEIVFCDATRLSDRELDINNLTGYGTLVVRGDLVLTGNVNWYGLIIVSGDIKISGSGNNIHGAIVAGDVAQLNGNINIYYDTCKIDNANSSYRYAAFRWEDKKLN